MAGKRTHARKIGERHRNDERARAGNNENVERAVDPRLPERGVLHAENERRQYGEQQRDRYHDRRVNTRKLRNEFFGFRLFCRGIFDQIENFRHGAFRYGTNDFGFHGVADVDATRKNLVARFRLFVIRFARHRFRIERRRRKQAAVRAHAVALAQQHGIARAQIVGVDFSLRIPFDENGGIAFEFHKFFDRTARRPHGDRL